MADVAGNVTSEEVRVYVIGQGNLSILANGVKALDEPLHLTANKIEFNITGNLGEAEIKWSYGYKTRGWFKDECVICQDNNIKTDREGWISVFISDSERNSKLIHILITD